MTRHASRVRRSAVAVGAFSLVLGLIGVAPAHARDDAGITTTIRSAPSGVPRASLAADARITALAGSRFLSRAAIKDATAKAGLVLDPFTGRILWRYNDAAPLRGASTTKLATAVTTLRVQGTATRFPTRVVTGRTPQEVVIVAGGDPMLTSTQLARLAHDTAAALLPVVPVAPPAPDPTVPAPAPTAWRISVRADDSLYPAPTLAPGWPSGYVPGVVSPVRALRRDLRHGSDTTKDAATYFASRLTLELRTLLAARTDLAPAAYYTGRLTAAAGATTLARFAGNTSGAALTWMLLVSDNDVAEMLYRNNAIARGRGASWAAGRATENVELGGLGIDIRGWALYDGSGVSRSDRLTARGLVQLLRTAISPAHPELAPLRGLLPVGGVSGTLSARTGRYTAAPTRCARGKVQAKTGTLHDAVALAGYARGADGLPRIFAVIVAPSGRYSQFAVRSSVDLVPTTATGCW